ncbi:hypothetical protein EBR21_10645 [bacterium]|nr:hypothetical protein [bacterium]
MNRFLPSVLFFSFLMSGCNSKSTSSDVKGFALQKTAFTSRNVAVCWENRSKADIELRAIRSELEQHVRTEFARTVVRLEGWKDCSDPVALKNEVRVTWWDPGESPGPMVDGASQIGNGAIYGPRWKSLQQQEVSKVKAAPTLALNSDAWREGLKMRGRAVAIADINSKFLHETGHAVGLLHEHARDDSTCDRNENVTMHMKLWSKAEEGLAAVMGSIVKTKAFDSESVMNYCQIERLQATGRVVRFSEGDIQTINQLYAAVR